jgi:tripartite-type tricarboxylate transporter receptor subunit TctC
MNFVFVHCRHRPSRPKISETTKLGDEMPHVKGLLSIALLCLLMSYAPTASQAQSWPTRPVHIIVPLPAGSAADTVARIVGTYLSEKLGQPVIVDNRDGASGAIATTQLARAEADGYTIGIATTTTIVTAPILNKNISYNPVQDFMPISMIGYSPYVLVVHPSVPANNLAEFIALAKANPGRLTYSSVGEGSLAHLAGELLSTMAGIKLTQVPYKTSTQAVIDLLGGRIDSQFGILTTTYQYIKDNKLRALGITTKKRLNEYPDIPTLSESGIENYDVSLWLALIAPAKVPTPIVTRLNSEINAILKQDDIKKRLFDQAIVVDTQTPDELKNNIAADFKKWSDLAAKTGL